MENEKTTLPDFTTCVNCGSSAMTVGGVGTTGGLQWNSIYAEGIFNKFGRYPMRAWLCLDCGMVHWQAIGNYQELREKLENDR